MTLKDWKERSKSQTAIMNELNEKAKSIPEVSVQGFAFPEINTGEQGPPIGFVISTSQDYGDLANVAGKFLEDMQKSSKFVYTTISILNLILLKCVLRSIVKKQGLTALQCNKSAVR
ncbi:MAG: hypothetical protein ACLR5N_05165 [Haemophilus parainfluenzae]